MCIVTDTIDRSNYNPVYIYEIMYVISKRLIIPPRKGSGDL